jgi:membrane associated rhomboid family serine protease
MAIYDRDYIFRNSPGSRGAGFGGLTANNWIIIINIVVAMAQVVMPKNVRILGGVLVDPLYAYGHFSTFEVATFAGGVEFWRFLTFQFLHADLLHIFFNMLGLYMFGSMVEAYLGSKKYVAFYLTCGIFGGFLYLLLNLLGQFMSFPGVLINDVRTPLIGASAGVFGVIMACAKIAPEQEVQLLLPPVTLRMRTMAYAYVGIALFSLIIGAKNAGGEAAHMGGAIAGFFFIRNSHLLRDFFEVFSNSRKGGEKKSIFKRGGPKLKLVGEPLGSRASVSTRGRDERGEEIARLERELDRILDRVNQVGAEGLTDEEKATLARATDLKRAADRGRTQG